MTPQGHPKSLILLKRVYDFLLDLNSNLGRILSRFRDITAFVRQMQLFWYPPLFRPKFQGVPIGVIRDVGVCREQTSQAN